MPKAKKTKKPQPKVFQILIEQELSELRWISYSQGDREVTVALRFSVCPVAKGYIVRKEKPSKYEVRVDISRMIRNPEDPSPILQQNEELLVQAVFGRLSKKVSARIGFIVPVSVFGKYIIAGDHTGFGGFVNTFCVQQRDAIISMLSFTSTHLHPYV